MPYKEIVAATYQGLPLSSVDYTIRSGWGADDGALAIDTERVDVSSLLRDRMRVDPWTPPGALVGALIPINRPQDVATVAVGRRAPATIRPDAGGKFKLLSEFGALILHSRDGPPVVIDRVYLARDTAHAVEREDVNGEQRFVIRVTDLRAYWPNLGDAYGHINVPMPGGSQGQYEPGTTDADGKPKSLATALAWLFAHCTGSPTVRGIADVSRGARSPEKIILEHESPYPILVKIFGAYGLDIQRDLDGGYTLFRRADIRARVLAAGHLITRQRTLKTTFGAPAVRVRGGYIRRNVERIFVAASRDLDGRVHDLETVRARWGFPADRMLGEIPSPGDRQFEGLSNEQREIAREDWGKFFILPSMIGADGLKRAPMSDAPILPFMRARTSALAVPRLATGGSLARTARLRTFDGELADGTGEQADIEEVPPIVIAETFSQRQLTTAEVLQQIDAEIRRINEELDPNPQAAARGVRGLRQMRLALERSIEALDLDALTGYDTPFWLLPQTGRLGVTDSFLGIFWVQTGEIDVPLEPITFPTEFGIAQRRLEYVRDQVVIRRAQIRLVEDEIMKKTQEAIALQQKRFALKNRLDVPSNHRLWMADGSRILDRGAYSLDQERGTLRTRAPVGFVVGTPSETSEPLELAAIPSVIVRYSVRYQTYTPGDRYSVVGVMTDAGQVLTAAPRGRWPDPIDMAREPVPLATVGAPAHVVKADDIVLKADEVGTPFNDRLCERTALELIDAHLAKRARQIEGITHVYEGWVAPDSRTVGVDSITYSTDGGAAKTAVVWNSPYHAFTRSPARADMDVTTVALIRGELGIPMVRE